MSRTRADDLAEWSRIKNLPAEEKGPGESLVKEMIKQGIEYIIIE